MKTRVETPKAQTFGNGEANSFTVKQDHKTFRAFSDGLYSDKIGSIIRELASNAIDAQRSANTMDKPFEIFLPCNKNPKFSIRDYGTGLSPEQITSIYTVYGESTKEDDNDNIGGFGLGSKTPFAYADQYFVRSYYNGKIYTYVFYFSADNPQYKLVGTTETDEPNGLEIYFDVSDDDFDEFTTKAKRILPWMQIMPNVWGSSEEINGFFKQKDALNHKKEWIELHNESILFENEKFIISRSDSLSKINFNQGGVVYTLGANFNDFPLLDILVNALNHYDLKIVLKCEIGTLELARSRENLSLSDVTKKNLNILAQDIIDDAKEAFSIAMKNNSKNSYVFNKFFFIFNNYNRNSYSLDAYKEKTISGNSHLMYFMYIARILHEKGDLDIDLAFEVKRNIVSFNESNFTDNSDISSRILIYNKYNSIKWAALRKRRGCEAIDFAVYSPETIKVICVDEGNYAANVLAQVSKVNASKNDSVIIVTMKKSAVPDGSDKKSVFDNNVLPNILNFFGADIDDIDLFYTSDLGLKTEKVVTARSKRNKYTFLISDHSQEHFSYNDPNYFKDKSIIVMNKKSHEVLIQKKTFKRKDAFLHAHLLSVATGFKSDRLVIANDKEIDALIKAGAKVTHIDSLIKKVKAKKLNPVLVKFLEADVRLSNLNYVSFTTDEKAIDTLYCKHAKKESLLDNHFEIERLARDEYNALKDKLLGEDTVSFKTKDFDDLGRNISNNISALRFTLINLLGSDFSLLEDIKSNVNIDNLNKDVKEYINLALKSYPLFNHIKFVHPNSDGYCNFEKDMLEYMSQIDKAASFSKIKTKQAIKA